MISAIIVGRNIVFQKKINKIKKYKKNTKKELKPHTKYCANSKLQSNKVSCSLAAHPEIVCLAKRRWWFSQSSHIGMFKCFFTLFLFNWWTIKNVKKRRSRDRSKCEFNVTVNDRMTAFIFNMPNMQPGTWWEEKTAKLKKTQTFYSINQLDFWPISINRSLQCSFAAAFEWKKLQFCNNYHCQSVFSPQLLLIVDISWEAILFVSNLQLLFFAQCDTHAFGLLLLERFLFYFFLLLMVWSRLKRD